MRRKSAGVRYPFRLETYDARLRQAAMDRLDDHVLVSEHEAVRHQISGAQPQSRRIGELRGRVARRRRIERDVLERDSPRQELSFQSIIR